MKVKSHSILALFLLCNAALSFTQQLSFVQNSHFNLFQENVAFAGNYNATHFNTSYSKLWSINGAPTQYSFSLHSPIKRRKLGVGFVLNQVLIGAHKETKAKGAIAYKLNLKKGLLSFGLSAGVSHYRFLMDKLDPLEAEDYILSQTQLENFIVDADFGVMYTNNKTYLGIEINQITSSSWKVHELDSSAQIPHFKLSMGKVFTLENEDYLRLSAHIRSDSNLKPQVDMMANYFLDKFLWFGLGYRLDYGILSTVEVTVNRRLQIGYMFSSALQLKQPALNNGHQVFLGYMLPTSPHKAPTIRNF